MFFFIRLFCFGIGQPTRWSNHNQVFSRNVLTLPMSSTICPCRASLSAHGWGVTNTGVPNLPNYLDLGASI